MWAECLLKLCIESGLTRARLLMESTLMLCKTSPKVFFNFALLTRHKQRRFLPMALGLSVLLCFFSKDGPETSLSWMIKSLGFLCGLSSQVYPYHAGISLSLLPKPLAKLSPRSLRKILMLAHSDSFASKLIFPRILRILWKSKLGLNPSLRRC